MKVRDLERFIRTVKKQGNLDKDSEVTIHASGCDWLLTDITLNLIDPSDPKRNTLVLS